MPIITPSSCPPASEVFHSITDLIDLEKLQKIQDTFAEANQVASSLIDVTGVPVTRTSNHSKVCKIIRATEKGLEKYQSHLESLVEERTSACSRPMSN